MREGVAHIGIDARMATAAGIGTYLRNLVPRLAAIRPAWRLTAFGDPDLIDRLGWSSLPNVATVRCDARYYSIAEQVEVPARVRRAGGVDLFWSPHYNVPLLVGAPLVVTVHDLCHLALRESTTSPFQRAYASFMYGQVRRRSRAILCDSEFTRGELGRLLGEPRCETAVAPLGVDEDWAAASGRETAAPLAVPYFLFVGAQKRHKNIPMLLRAFARVRDRLPHHLVLVGPRAGVSVDPAIDRTAEAIGDRVHFTGEVAPDVLRQYVAHASAFVTTSLYEGFGLPPLEAMAAGCPCVVAASGSLPEVCGDAALYCDPRDEDSIARRMYEVATDAELRDGLIERGRARARQFTWERTAAITADVMERALPRVTA